MNLTNEERETHLNMVASDRGQWIVFSDDPVMIRRLERIGAEFIRDVGQGKEFRLRSEQVLLRTGKRKISEAQRRKASETMRALRKRGSEPG